MTASLDTRSMVRDLIALLAELPARVDSCGERGEFLTLWFRCPEFSRASMAAFWITGRALASC
jgi:diphthamide synthase (EF-2-diphthine--ammonia ligase)